MPSGFTINTLEPGTLVPLGTFDSDVGALRRQMWSVKDPVMTAMECEG